MTRNQKKIRNQKEKELLVTFLVIKSEHRKSKSCPSSESPMFNNDAELEYKYGMFVPRDVGKRINHNLSMSKSHHPGTKSPVMMSRQRSLADDMTTEWYSGIQDVDLKTY